MHTFLAVDLGATSGRTMIGRLDNGVLSQQELTRFANPIIEVDGHFFWDIFALYHEIVKALKRCADEKIAIESIGIDTWGVDFVCFGADGLPLRNPVCYRDPYTTHGTMERFFETIPQKEVYEKTGIQFMNFNSLFQMAQQKADGNSALLAADKVLFIPDALSYMLTGEAVCEYTILSTSQLLNPRNGQIDDDLLAAVGLRREQFGRMVMPGERVGVLCESVRRQTGLGAVPVIAVAGHDTASAVAAVPAEADDYAYLSCGTWSLLGIESEKPIISQKSFELNFTNEGGVFGTTRFLKNICGLWILSRCQEEWTDAPRDVVRLIDEAMATPSCGTLLNPDDPVFANPPSMLEAIASYCKSTAQTVPQGYAQTTRCIFESLANRYNEVIAMLRQLSPKPINRLHVIGGGSLNKALMQLTADATGLTVVAGPSEGTAMGNILLQAYAQGIVDNIWSLRKIVARSVELKTYEPRTDRG